MDYLINIQNRQESLQQSRSELTYENPSSSPPSEARTSKENNSFQQPWSGPSLRSPKSPVAPTNVMYETMSNLSPKPQVIATKVETPSSIVSSSTFMSRFTSLKSLLDDNDEPTQSSSGFFSKFSSTSASSSTTSLAKQNQISCFICKKPFGSTSFTAASTTASSVQGAVSSQQQPRAGESNAPGKFRRWRKEMLVYNYSSSSTEKPQQIKPTGGSSVATGQDLPLQCVDCNNYVCERCGNMTSPDFGSKDTSTLSPNRDVTLIRS